MNPFNTTLLSNGIELWKVQLFLQIVKNIVLAKFNPFSEVLPWKKLNFSVRFAWSILEDIFYCPDFVLVGSLRALANA